MTSNNESTQTMSMRCPNSRCRVLIQIPFKPADLEVKVKCKSCEREFKVFPTGQAPDEGIHCHHSECNHFYPIRPLTAEEYQLYTVMPLGGGYKQYFCKRECYDKYRALLAEQAKQQAAEEAAERQQEKAAQHEYEKYVRACVARGEPVLA